MKLGKAHRWCFRRSRLAQSQMGGVRFVVEG